MIDAKFRSGVVTSGLRVQGLSITLATHPRPVVAVEDVSLSIPPGRTLALAGESGSGKSLLGLALAGLLPDAAKVQGGHTWLDGRPLLDIPAAERRRRAGRDIGIVFQEPMTALNPVITVGSQLAEVPRLHGHGAAESRDMARAMLERVQVDDAARVMAAYPHQLSGGLRQRVLIAMALVLSPRLLVADEPTTALDVTLQAGILALLQSLQRERGTAMLIVSHDLAMLAEVADEVVVLYAGRVVEQAPAAALFSRPRHPYTQGLLAARSPLAGSAGSAGVRSPLVAIEGSVPPPGARPAGCVFEPRCGRATPRCRAERPPLEAVGPGHLVACFEAERP